MRGLFSYHVLPLAFMVAGLVAVGFFMKPVAAKVMPEVIIVDQVSDNTAAVAARIFRFTPDVLAVEPGQPLRFLNSVGAHTVTSQPELWPEGVEMVNIQGQEMADVIFATPGLYGITCARHGRYGMNMLIAVGDAGLDAARTLDTDDIKASKLARDAYQRRAASLRAQDMR